MKLVKRFVELLRVKLGLNSASDTKEPSEDQATLSSTVETAMNSIHALSQAFSSPWTNNPSISERAVFGTWANKSVRHLHAITVLAQEGDLVAIAEVHFRQLVEIMLQVRFLASRPIDERELLAKKVAAWGCVDYLDKMARFKDEEFASAGYKEVSEILTKFDPALVTQINKEMSKGARYWYGRSPSTLAKNVSEKDEDLKSLFHIVSAQLHGSWHVALGVSMPEPGHLVFREYPDDTTLNRWAAELIDRSTRLCIRIWNSIADAVGAPRVLANSANNGAHTT